MDSVYVDAFSDRIQQLGAIATEIVNADADTEAEQAIFGEPSFEHTFWHNNRVKILFPAHLHGVELVRLAAHDVGLDEVRDLSVEQIDDQDWVRANHAQLQ